MSEALERAIISGASVEDALETARQEQYRSTSPTRSASPSTSEELGSDADGGRSASPLGAAAPSVPVDRPGANTGVKGVRADARAVEAAARSDRVARVQATNAHMERMALSSGTTWREDEAMRKLDEEAAVQDAAELERIRAARVEQLRAAQRITDERRRRRMAGEEDEEEEGRSTVLELPQEGVAGAARRAVSRRTGFFGHLREVDESGYADAIDREAPTTSVVVHLYERIVPACARLTASLASLARLYPHTKFLQARASDIGFGTGGVEASEDDDEKSRVDKAAELVPTLLVYRAGVVVANLVRVDLDEAWGGGEEKSIRELLASHGAIFTTPAPAGGANGSIVRNADDNNDD